MADAARNIERRTDDGGGEADHSVVIGAALERLHRLPRGILVQLLVVGHLPAVPVKLIGKGTPVAKAAVEGLQRRRDAVALSVARCSRSISG